MKTHILNILAAVALAALPAYADEEKKASSASSSTVVNGDGTATVTIEVNGKKQTKTIKLKDGEPFTLKIEEDGATAIAGGGAGKPGRQPAIKEKATWLGVGTEEIGDEVRAQLPLKSGEGVSVTHVMPESPAAKAGIEKHDILTRLDDQILVSQEQLKSLVKMRKPGDKAKLAYLRKGQPHDAEVTLEEHEFRGSSTQGSVRSLPPEVVEKDALRFFGMPGEWRKNLKDRWPQAEEIQNHLKQMKEKFPGVIVDSKAFVVGPDGKLKEFADGKINDALEQTRKFIDEAKLPEIVKDEIRKAVESALHEAKGAVKDAEKAARDAVNDAEKAAGDVLKEVEKKDAEKK